MFYYHICFITDTQLNGIQIKQYILVKLLLSTSFGALTLLVADQ